MTVVVEGLGLMLMQRKVLLMGMVLMLMVLQQFQGREAWDGGHVSSLPEETIGPCAGAQKTFQKNSANRLLHKEMKVWEEGGGDFGSKRVGMLKEIPLESICAWMCMWVLRLYWLLYVLRHTGQGTALGTLPALWYRDT